MTGEVLMFNGTVSEIPEGYALSDGNNGTTDLGGYPLVCVSDASTDPGATVGQDSYSISESEMASHNHNISTDSFSHKHTTGANPDARIENDAGAPDPGAIESPTGGFGERSGSAGAHDHGTVSVGSAGGSSSSVDNRPSMKSQLFIERIAEDG